MLNSTINSNEFEYKNKKMRLNGGVVNGTIDEYSGSVVGVPPIKQISKIQSVQNFSQETDQFNPKKQRKGEQRYYDNIAYSNNNDHQGGSSQSVHLTKSVENLHHVKQKRQVNDNKFMHNNNNMGSTIPKINSTGDINRGLQFGNKFLKKNKNRDWEKSDYGSSHLIIKDAQFIETSVQEFPEM